MAIIGLLACLIFPALNKVRDGGDSSKCLSNMRQIGVAMTSYVSDHDGMLPGPFYAGQFPYYSTTTYSGMLAGALASYLDLPPATTWSQEAKVFMCPGFGRKAPRRFAAPPYLLRTSVKIGDMNVNPFGYFTDGTQPIKMVQLTEAGLSSTWAMTEMDQQDYKTASASWYQNLPKNAVHGKDTRNALFFDFHVGRVNNTYQVQ